jgi:4-hydroxy-tetrahydrodipicolinate reductase
MKIGLIGFGRAGKAVASVILNHPAITLNWVIRYTKQLSHRSAAEYLGVESTDPATIYSVSEINYPEFLSQHPVDFIIDFSNEKSIYQYGEAAVNKGIKIISAISHYAEHTVSFLKKLAEKATVFWSPNITLGINYLIFAARFLKKIAPWVDVEIVEEHFKQKTGVSGTAIKIAHSLQVDPSTIHVVRAGGIVGRHEIIFGFPYQTVRLIHESISREAFGNGVIFVAQNLQSKEKGFYNFEDILLPYFSK